MPFLFFSWLVCLEICQFYWFSKSQFLILLTFYIDFLCLISLISALILLFVFFHLFQAYIALLSPVSQSRSLDYFKSFFFSYICIECCKFLCKDCVHYIPQILVSCILIFTLNIFLKRNIKGKQFYCFSWNFFVPHVHCGLIIHFILFLVPKIC